jgi:capsular polysaccharide biosynthesis protein
VLYLPNFGIQVCDGFVPEEAINYRQHLDIVVGRDPTHFAPNQTIVNFDEIERSDADVCILGQMFSKTFGHWAEELIKVIVLENFGFTGYYVLQEDSPRHCHDSLILLGVAKNRIISTINPVIFRTSFLTTTIHHFNSNEFPQVIFALRDRLYAATENEAGAGRRIWVERGEGAAGRDVVNKDEVYSCIDKYGFQRIDFGQLTFRQQIGIDREMRVMAGVHGSAFVHCGFMNTHGTVIEIFSPNHINPSVIQLCRAMSHYYHQIVPTNQDYLPYKFARETMVEIDHLDLILSTFLNTSI